MPKKGIIKCQTCDAEFRGILPDSMPAGWHYSSLPEESDEKRINDHQLVESLQKHHQETRIHTGQSGHSYFDVFLEDGAGEVEANSYAVFYTESDPGRLK